MDVKKIGIAGVIITVLLILIALYGQQKTEEKVKRLLSENSLEEQVEYDSVSFNPLTFSSSLNDVVIHLDRRTQLQFDSLTFHRFSFDKSQKQADVDVSFKLKEVPVNEAPQAVKKILVIPTMLGLPTFSSEGRVTVEADGKVLDFELLLGVGDIAGGEFNLAAEYDLNDSDFGQNLTNMWLSAMFEGASVLNKVRIENIHFGLYNQGLLPKIMAQIKKRDNYDEARQHHDLLKFVDSIGLAKSSSSEAEHIASELDDFISSPDELRITIKPDDFISLSEFHKAIRSKNAYSRFGMDISS